MSPFSSTSEGVGVLEFRVSGKFLEGLFKGFRRGSLKGSLTGSKGVGVSGFGFRGLGP